MTLEFQANFILVLDFRNVSKVEYYQCFENKNKLKKDKKHEI